MGPGVAGGLFVGSLALAIVLVYRPFGEYLYRSVTAPAHTRVERTVYRLVGVDPEREQSWGGYARAVLAFSAVSTIALYLFQRVQQHLWLSLGNAAVEPARAWNTAISFVTNTNWQSYSGESTMGHLVQMAGLAVQNFVSAAVGTAVAVAFIRGFARTRTDRLGSFWVDLTRIVLRVLLPVAAPAAVALMAAGVVQNLGAGTDVGTLAGGTQTVTGGPVAGQEAIKQLGTNGGGFYNANSAHPFENPTAWTNWIQLFLVLLIPFCLPRVFGRMVGDKRQGLAIAAVMATLAILSVAAVNAFQLNPSGTVPAAVGAATEGTETRFGVSQSATFAALTTLTSTGAVNSFHDSYTALGGLVPMVNMMLGEVAPGGAGSGLYGMLVLAVITVFVAGLMVGRTPEYVRKKIGAREMTFASLYLLTTPALVLVGTAVAMSCADARAAMANDGPHGLSEVLYAFTSASNNNGSAFAGLGVDTTFYNTALGLCMAFGRFLPIVLVLALAGSLARQHPVPASVGTLPTHRPLFVGMVTGVTVIVVALTFLPALALGPLAEGFR
ncbi:potassium-transporting ATPase potassium-binding subunit [Virgisporangium aliadipatigenens]|uniref:Potassium-transporting ATPase potassium-binding subunit n=1 Tax=Virgisporangium aliadipatigenens TaxID=741659 RepID=A0A8J3YK39_9ACTN|nr:potassium-transporting ATPase subunit KdpA [Virgisporangium aliadipatigenens]GIJ46804.1 potassium-transporting ATPase potassium-binding subunit [Virgisporangium aliadipatigenens]